MRFSLKNQQRYDRFKANKRGFYSLILFVCFFILSLGAQLIANDKPLIVFYKSSLYFPILKAYPETTFGGTFDTATDYKESFIRRKINEDGFFIMPLIPFSYDTISYDLPSPAPSRPTLTNWLGTDDLGRDVLARLIYGFRFSLIFGFALTLFSSVIGVVAGAIQGYFGGKIDLVFQRILEIWSSLPQLFILIIVAGMISPNFWTLLFVLLIFSWTTLVPVVRAEFLRSRNFDYVKSAKALGVPSLTLIFRHIFPNAMVATLTYLPFILSGAIISLTALDFLGFGLPPGSPSLGELIRQGKDNLQAPWLSISAFISLAGLLTMLVFIGEAFRDAFDPRKKK